jgi:superfamily I DNA/RNA helicase
MDLHPALVARLARLAPDQRAAATAPPGPILCVAPAGSGKTTTLIARIAWLIGCGVDPATITTITFNRRAAEELSERLTAALEPLGLHAGAVRVRTFHALGREILRDAGQSVEPLVDRDAVLRSVLPEAEVGERRRLDTAISRLKLDLGVTADEVAADPEAGPIARAFVAYERAVAATGGLDFDDLVVRALRALDDDTPLLHRWRERCGHLLVDEVQDVDRSQLLLALLLAAPANRILLVGDDDQSIYGWRLADVRRVLDLDGALPGLRRIDLVTNFRCPAPVVERAVRLVTHNRERFAKAVAPRPGAAGRLVLAPDASDAPRQVERILRSWPDDGGSRAFLARTNRELLPGAIVALDLGLPFRATGLVTPLDDARLDGLLVAVTETDPRLPLLLRLGRVREAASTTTRPPRRNDDADADEPGPHGLDTGDERRPGSLDGTSDPEVPEAFSLAELASALLAWAPPYPDLASFAGAVRERRARLADLRHDDANLTFATAHATKGLEFDHVTVLGMDAGRFPSARAITDAAEPERALEEERRLAYVAWTRARRSLTLSFDPATPSPFLAEAFTPEELSGLAPRVNPGRRRTTPNGRRTTPDRRSDVPAGGHDGQPGWGAPG